MAGASLHIGSPVLRQIGGVIGRRWVGQNAPLFAIRNPATGELLAQLPALGSEEATAAIDAATAPTPVPPVRTRQQWLANIATLLAEYRDDLARLITLEQGKPLSEACAEVDYSAGFFRFYAQHLPRLLEPETLGALHRHDWSIHPRPAGATALITPWNFPLAMLAKKLAAAIAAGCTAVVKPAESTPLTSIALWNLLETLDFPPNLAQLLIGPAAPIGEVLCADPRLRLLSFTGSTATGRLLATQAAPSLKRLALELGGNAPFLVFDDVDDALLESAVNALMLNKFRCAGQTCVCTNRVYLHRAIYPVFVERLASRVSSLCVGDGLKPETEIGPLINSASVAKVREHLADALANGAELMATAPLPLGTERGSFFPPTLITGCTPAMKVFREETFGPLLSVSAFENEDQALSAANDTPYGLAAYCFTGSPERARECAARLQFGHVAINSGAGPTPEAPFGGVKQSGYGREGGREGVLEFCELQTVATRV